jgi:RNA recognition motif-containing protein
MLGTVLRTRAFALPGSALSITRFLPALSVSARASSLSTPRAFTSSQISREYGYSDKRGDSEGRSSESSYVRPPRPPKNPPSQTLWIGNLPFAATGQQVEELLSEFGTITSVRIGTPPLAFNLVHISPLITTYCKGTSPSGESKGFAHVDVTDVATAEAIMKANTDAQFFLDGRALFLDYAVQSTGANNEPRETLHFSNYSGDEALLQEAFKEFEDVIQETKISAYLHNLFQFYV